MSKHTTQMLRDLIKRVESGETLITSFDVNCHVEDGKETGNESVYIGLEPAVNEHWRMLEPVAYKERGFYGPPKTRSPQHKNDDEAAVAWSQHVIDAYKNGLTNKGAFIEAATRSLETLRERFDGGPSEGMGTLISDEICLLDDLLREAKESAEAMGSGRGEQEIEKHFPSLAETIRSYLRGHMKQDEFWEILGKARNKVFVSEYRMDGAKEGQG